ncbi:DUF4190 domain-containing protein [Microbacterium oleivorans]|uniref:DUF4190 domain-containing protein n=1 Tax=Microbacterium oleivorans TaxID=273677 RepID=A0A031FXE9_9MICO|nr:DUF4190 domain-containing protein [Microbacterium oleivorans]EZP29534.1 hypothetical protein BW34_00147 [Microbacterium oleivorans]
MTDATNTPPQPSNAPPAPPAPDSSASVAPPYAPSAYGQPPAAPVYGQQSPGAPVYGQQYSQPGYPQPGYGQPAYGQPGYGYAVAPARPTNVLAIVSLIASIAGLTILPFVASIVGIITGHMALKQLKTSGENGRGLALGGTIVGWVGGGILLLIIAFWLIFIVAFAASAPAFTQVS